jgi:sulfite exporter TauE/SafE/copper chaperone CopZ
MSELKIQKFKLNGLHCSSCEKIVTQALSDLSNVKKITVSQQTNQLTIVHRNEEINPNTINKLLNKYGYSIANGWSWLAFVSYLLIIIFIAVLLIKYNWTSFGSQLTSPATAFVFGLTASLSSCLAIVGGFVISLSILVKEKTPGEKLIAHGLFHFGRFISFVILGGLLGLLGKIISFSPSSTAFLMIVVGATMLWLAFRQLGISLPWLNNKKLKIWPSSNFSLPFAFIIGALTFFIPCGFTQAIQLYAITSGSFVLGAIASGLFVLGTAPVLILLGWGFSGFIAKKQYVFNRIAGFAIGVAAVVIINNGLVLIGHGFSFSQPAVTSQQNKNEQIVKMEVSNSGYQPRTIELIANLPVRWQINVKEINGCNSTIIVPKYNIIKQLSLGQNEILFIPNQKGKILFSCGMGMITGQFIIK